MLYRRRVLRSAKQNGILRQRHWSLRPSKAINNPQYDGPRLFRHLQRVCVCLPFLDFLENGRYLFVYRKVSRQS